jgi:glyoxylate reductase
VNRVYVTRVLPGNGIDRLRAVSEVNVWPEDRPPSAKELRVAVVEVDGLVSMVTDYIDEALLRAAPKLRVLGTVGVGLDNIDVAACTARRVLVANTPGVLTEATADVAFGLIIAASRRFKEASAAVLEGSWGPWRPDWMCGKELYGATLGIVGLGAIGKAVARRATAFGMKVVYHSRSGGLPLAELLAGADIVSLHCPLTSSTRGLIGEREFAMMKPDAIFVNTARGAIVDQDALYRALADATIGAAGLDVAVSEPLDPASPLLRLPNCYVLPHIGSATSVTRYRMADVATDAVATVLSGGVPSNLVNPEALESYTYDSVGREE